VNTDSLALHVAWFENQGEPGKPAYGDPETTTWGNFASIFTTRREGEKDGCCVAVARFKLEPDGKHVRRKGANLLARTAVALDIETSKATGEVPPPLDVAAERVKHHGLAGVVYTSHNHRPGNVRFRVILPISEEIDHTLPVVEVAAGALGLTGVLDMSKRGAASLFFLPSYPWDGDPDQHQTIILTGRPIEAASLIRHATALQAERQAEADRIAAAAREDAERRRQERIAGGFNPDDSLIEKLRSRFDLESVLTSHGYEKQGTKYRHPNSSSGCYGADIATFGGIERLYSHNATDPLHRDNLPAWCTVAAVDAVDATIILDYGDDRTRALRELAERFNLTKAAERKALAALLHSMVRQRATQAEIEQAAFAEGERRGLSRSDVISVAKHVAAQSIAPREAA
jgi:hypothetical protein